MISLPWRKNPSPSSYYLSHFSLSSSSFSSLHWTKTESSPPSLHYLPKPTAFKAFHHLLLHQAFRHHLKTELLASALSLQSPGLIRQAWLTMIFQFLIRTKYIQRRLIFWFSCLFCDGRSRMEVWGGWKIVWLDQEPPFVKQWEPRSVLLARRRLSFQEAPSTEILTLFISKSSRFLVLIVVTV